MPKKAKSTSPTATTTSSVGAATVADVEAANAQVASNRKKPIETVSTALVSKYGTPALQDGLIALQAPLASFAGCGDVKTTLALATEGLSLAGSFERLQAATNQVGQRVIQINQELKAFDTALNKAQASAAQGSPVQKGLKTLNTLRQSAISRTKGKRTKNKNVKAKAAKGSSKT